MQNEYTIGVDIGGTKMDAILWNGEKVIADYKLGTPKDKLKNLVTIINALLDPLFEKAKKDKISVKGIGLGIAGSLDINKQKVLVAPNIPILDKTQLARIIEQETGIRTVMDNDTRCFVCGEALFGAGRKYNDIYGIILGTGIGGAWFHDGKIHEGIHGGAGEPGSITIDCLSGIKIESAYHQMMQNNPAKFAEEAYRGDELARKKFEEFGRMLGLLLSAIANIVDPEVFIIGGGTSESSSLFVKIAQETMRQYIESTDSKKIKIIKSQLGKHAGAIGAALLPLQS